MEVKAPDLNVKRREEGCIDFLNHNENEQTKDRTEQNSLKENEGIPNEDIRTEVSGELNEKEKWTEHVQEIMNKSEKNSTRAFDTSQGSSNTKEYQEEREEKKTNEIVQNNIRLNEMCNNRNHSNDIQENNMTTKKRNKRKIENTKEIIKRVKTILDNSKVLEYKNTPTLINNRGKSKGLSSFQLEDKFQMKKIIQEKPRGRGGYRRNNWKKNSIQSTICSMDNLISSNSNVNYLNALMNNNSNNSNNNNNNSGSNPISNDNMNNLNSVAFIVDGITETVKQIERVDRRKSTTKDKLIEIANHFSLLMNSHFNIMKNCDMDLSATLQKIETVYQLYKKINKTIKKIVKEKESKNESSTDQMDTTKSEPPQDIIEQNVKLMDPIKENIEEKKKDTENIIDTVLKEEGTTTVSPDEKNLERKEENVINTKEEETREEKNIPNALHKEIKENTHVLEINTSGPVLKEGESNNCNELALKENEMEKNMLSEEVSLMKDPDSKEESSLKIIDVKILLKKRKKIIKELEELHSQYFFTLNHKQKVINYLLEEINKRLIDFEKYYKMYPSKN